MSQSSLARNAGLNFAGLLFPLVLAVLVVPPIIKELGIPRFGILALVWGIFNYFAILDFGIGRALTHAVSVRIRTSRENEIRSACYWSLLLTAAVAVVLSGALFPFVAVLVDTLTIPSEHRAETHASFQLVLVGLILIVTSSALNGYLVAYERFDLVNLVKIPVLAGTLCAPLLASGHSEPILASTAIMLGIRFAAWFVLAAMCRLVSPPGVLQGRARVSNIRTLLSFGSWITLVNAANCLLTYLDRWALGAWVSLTAVTYYTVPFEVATKLWIVPAAIAAALFPTFCRLSAQESSKDSEVLLFLGTGYTMAMSFLTSVPILLFAEDILTVWLDGEFGKHSTAVFQILLIGTFVNSVAHTSAALLQGSGRPHWIAFLLLVELPLFALALWVVVPEFGAIGAALVWTGRVAIDAAALCYLAARLGGASRPLGAMSTTFTAFLLVLMVGTSLTSLTAKLALIAAALALFTVFLVWLTTRARTVTVS